MFVHDGPVTAVRVRLRSSQALVQHTGERIDVDARGDGAFEESFRGHIRQGSDRHSDGSNLLRPSIFRDSEVHEISEVVPRDEDVRRFDVTVNEPVIVRCVDGGSDLTDDGHCPPGRERTVLFDQCAEIGSLDQPHVDEQSPINLPVVVDGYHMRLLEAGGGVGFTLEPFSEHRVRRRVVRE
jgi:hypothetical protein